MTEPDIELDRAVRAVVQAAVRDAPLNYAIGVGRSRGRRPSRWLAAAAVVTLIAVAVSLFLRDRTMTVEPSAETSPVTSTDRIDQPGTSAPLVVDRVVDLSSAVDGSSPTWLVVARIPAATGAPPSERGPGLGVVVPSGDGESYGPSVVAWGRDGVYVADPVNRRISRFTGRGGAAEAFDVDLPTALLRDLSALAVDEAGQRFYLQVGATIASVDATSGRVMWHRDVAGASPRSLRADSSRLSVSTSSGCLALDPSTGDLTSATTVSCVTTDVRDGGAQVLVETASGDRLHLTVTSDDTLMRIEIGDIDPSSATISGTALVVDAHGSGRWVAFRSGPTASQSMSLPTSTDPRFDVQMPLAGSGGVAGVWYVGGVVGIATYGWSVSR